MWEPSERGPLPCGVFTTNVIFPDAIRSTADVPVRSDSLATMPSTSTPKRSRYSAVPRVATIDEVQLLEAAGHHDARRLVPVGQRQEDRAVGGQRGAGRRLRLHEGQPEALVDAHHLAGRAHLRAERGVDLGEAVERQHRLLHRDVPAGGGRSQQALLAQTGQRGAHHDARRHLGQRHAGGLGHERHRAAGARIGLQHVHLVLAHGVLHVEEAADVEGVGQWPWCRPR